MKLPSEKHAKFSLSLPIADKFKIEILAKEAQMSKSSIVRSILRRVILSPEQELEIAQKLQALDTAQRQ